MNLDSIMQVLWGGEISSLALIVTLLPLICQSLGDRYYLGENLSNYILNNKVVLKKILIVSLLLNFIVLGLALIPPLLSLSEISKNLFIFLAIIILIGLFIYLFYNVFIVIECLADGHVVKKCIGDEKLKKMQSYTYPEEYNNETKVWFKYSHENFYDAKETVTFISSNVNNKEPSRKINYNLNNTLSNYFKTINSSGSMTIEEITNLLIEWNNICNGKNFVAEDNGSSEKIYRPKFAFLVSLSLDQQLLDNILSKENNAVAGANKEDFKKLVVTLIFSKYFVEKITPSNVQETRDYAKKKLIEEITAIKQGTYNIKGLNKIALI